MPAVQVLAPAQHRRLNAFYLFYFGLLGVFLPYWGPYLEMRGFNAVQIGQCFAAITGAKLIAPTLWAWLADHTGRRLTVIRMTSIATLCVFAWVPWTESFPVFLILMLTYGFFWYAVLPQFEVLTLSYLGVQAHRYSTIRLWGSVGFIVAVLLLGPLSEHYGYHVLPWAMMLIFAVIVLVGFMLRGQIQTPMQSTVARSIWHIIVQRPVWTVLLAAFLMQLSHAPYYAFFSIHLQNLHYSKALIGGFWAIGVAAEILIFISMHRLLGRYSARYLLMLCFAVTTMRWLMIGYGAERLSLLLLAQLLHAFSFGLFHSVMVNQIRQYFSGRYHGRGQALYASLSFGGGGALGALMSGYIWTHAGAAWSYTVAAAVAMLGFILIAFSLRSRYTVE